VEQVNKKGEKLKDEFLKLNLKSINLEKENQNLKKSFE